MTRAEAEHARTQRHRAAASSYLRRHDGGQAEDANLRQYRRDMDAADEQFRAGTEGESDDHE